MLKVYILYLILFVDRNFRVVGLIFFCFGSFYICMSYYNGVAVWFVVERSGFVGGGEIDREGGVGGRGVGEVIV